MYSTYEQYQSAGGKLTEEQYTIYAAKAASMIDYKTLHRADSAPPEMRASLGLASESIDGYSYTVKADPAVAQSRAIDDVLRRYLFRPDLGVNLLCRGLDA